MKALGVIAAQKASNKVMQVGSQRVSSLVYAKAHELYKSGEIGKLNMVNAIYDRQDALGAWEYTMPTDGSPKQLTGTGILRVCPKCLMILKSFSGGGIIENLVQVWPAICLFIFFQARMLSPVPKAPNEYLLPGNCVIGKMAAMCPM